MPKLAPAPAQYARDEEQQLRNELERRDDMNLKKDQHIAPQKGVAIRLYDTVTGEQVEVTVASGALVVTPL